MPVRDLLMSASGASTPATYVDDVFSTYLYTGTGATQSINNGIDLTKGGMTWIKSRSAATNNNLFDTVQGVTKLLHSNTQDTIITDTNSLTAFNSNGFTLGSGNTTGNQVNTSAATYVSWTFRKAPKFFDIVQYTGTGAVQAINHNLGSNPGCIIVKCTNASGISWVVYHKGLNGGTTPEQYAIILNTTAAQSSNSVFWNNTAPTSTQFTVGTAGGTNTSGNTYIAYIFADQAGGFGATGTDSAIACGSYTGNGGNVTVNLGWEPQWVLRKDTTSAANWILTDVIRGTSYTNVKYLYANTSGAEIDNSGFGVVPTATGFIDESGWGSGENIIYIAIRRPNKPPTTGTSVFSPIVAVPTSSGNTVTTGFPVDLAIFMQNSQASQGNFDVDRLRGDSTNSYAILQTTNTAAEVTGTGFGFGFDNNNAVIDRISYGNGATTNVTYWNFKRSPTFFDEVCYAGNGTAGTTINHNLTVAPEMMIVKARSNPTGWAVYHKGLNNGFSPQNYTILLNFGNAQLATSVYWNNTAPTSSVFTVGNGTYVNASAITYVAYLFATCAGVSYVGSFTGTGGTQSIACGFGSGGARFILIKRTDSTGDWYCFDSANGLTSSSSPYLTWDTTNAQTTGNNGCYASSGGFTLTSSASSTVNINGGSYIFLAIA